MQGYWQDFKAPQMRALPSDTIAVLPLGATEQHGPHLPLCVDTALTDAVAARALQELHPDLNVLVLPTLTTTKSDEHNRHPGTLSLGAETLLAILRDVVASVARADVSRMVFLNGHGGNNAVLDIAARAARVDHQMIVACAGWSAFADHDDLFDANDIVHDLHAGAFETSAMLDAAPHLVDMSCAQNFATATRTWQDEGRLTGLTGQPARPGWIIDDLNPKGAVGNAAAATAEAGAALIDRAGKGFARWLADFATFDLDGRT